MSRNPFADESPLFDGAPADEPLFLQPTSRDRMIENGAGTIIGVFVALTLIFSVIEGFSTSATHFFLGIVLLMFSAVTVQLISWFRLGDLDPKFKLAILTMVLGVCLLVIVANVYFWAPPAINPVCGNTAAGNAGGEEKPLMYDTIDKQCWLRCSAGHGLDRSQSAPGACKPFAPA
ncbi:hypothetical protein HDU89_005689 [Geranomyces variabilis]|nr:hypothetical protein HDU89_005689 [Geranomyces variabilis]